MRCEQVLPQIIPIRIIAPQHSLLLWPPQTKFCPNRPSIHPNASACPRCSAAPGYGLNQAFRRRIAHLEITPDQFTVLRTLLENEGITQRELTQLISSDPNTVASLLERMQSAALIERKTHEKDRRANRLKLQPAGKKKYIEAREIALELQKQVLSVLPEAKREEFLHDLTLVADACRDPSLGRSQRTIVLKPGADSVQLFDPRIANLDDARHRDSVPGIQYALCVDVPSTAERRCHRAFSSAWSAHQDSHPE